MKAHEVKRIQDPQVEEAFRQLEENNDGAWRMTLAVSFTAIVLAYLMMSPVESPEEKKARIVREHNQRWAEQETKYVRER